jgi:hypothetical protein
MGWVCFGRISLIDGATTTGIKDQNNGMYQSRFKNNEQFVQQKPPLATSYLYKDIRRRRDHQYSMAPSHFSFCWIVGAVALLGWFDILMKPTSQGFLVA